MFEAIMEEYLLKHPSPWTVGGVIDINTGQEDLVVVDAHMCVVLAFPDWRKGDMKEVLALALVYSTIPLTLSVLKYLSALGTEEQINQSLIDSINSVWKKMQDKAQEHLEETNENDSD